MDLPAVDHYGAIMPRRHPAEFRREVLDLAEAGRPVAEIAEQLSVTGRTIYNWRNYDLFDREPWPGGSGAAATVSQSPQWRGSRVVLS